MRRRSVLYGYRRVLAAGAVLSSTAFLAGQTPATSKPASAVATKYSPPHLANGQPDLQGVWSYATITPLERPEELGDKAVLTPAEAEAWTKMVIARDNKDTRPENKTADVGAAYNDFWWDRGTRVVGTRRTSLVTDPPNGRIPSMTAEGQNGARARGVVRVRLAEGPEDRPAAERCIIGFNAGPPMIPSAYNNNTQIFQTGDHVGIVNEMIHEVRVVPLDNRPRVNASVGFWRGVSRGRWDGDTLVVETTNFNEGARVSYDIFATTRMRVVERFTRVAADTLLYEFTVADPTTWTKPWGGQLPMTKSTDRIYEYACHEGNYAMEHMLSGARADERALQDAARKK